MTRDTFAELLFFTRAAVEADSALSTIRIEGPLAHGFGLARMPQKADWANPTPLTIAGLYRVWDNPEASLPCERCGARRLFLDASAGAIHRLIAFVHLLCPFCRETNHGREATFTLFKTIRDVCVQVAEADASTPSSGLPFSAAIARLRTLRDTDLLDPTHPLETASLAAAHVRPPVLTGHPLAAIEDARIRARIATPERIARACSLREEIRAEQRRVIEEAEVALAPLRGRPGVPSPKERFKRGELSLSDYRAILAQKRSLAAPINTEHLRRELDTRLVRDIESNLGRFLSADERRVFLDAVAAQPVADAEASPAVPTPGA